MAEELPEIRILSDDVANKIAAGEVIERPASAVKELLENSLDAKATKLEISFKNGGKSFIKITDNGHGMRKDQALTALEAHATSKIKTAADLDTVLSFGFRGEALPSIASISKFTILTKPTAQTLGTKIEIFAGQIKDVKECAIDSGTQMIVEDLFCSVPARRKFLKTDNTEAEHIIKTCRLYALSRPDVSFTLLEDDKTVFKSSPTKSLIQRVEKIFGAEISDKLMPLKSFESYGISIEGAVSKPNESWASARNIYTFINGRPIDSRIVYSALKEAYEDAIPSGRYPAAFLFINLDTRFVDVNVHPAKREVRLKNDYALRNAILAALADSLENFAPKESFDAPKISEPEEVKIEADSTYNHIPKEPMPESFFSRRQAIENLSPIQIAAQNLQAELAANKNANLKEIFKTNEGVKTNSNAEVFYTQKTENENLSIEASWKYLSHLNKKFVLFETQSNSLILMSIPAALKRISYDKIMRSLEGEKAEAQALLIPINIEFTRSDNEIFKNNLSAFQKCGFSIEEFGENFYRISAIPTWIEFTLAGKFIEDFVEIAKEEGSSFGKKTLANQVFAKLASTRTQGADLIEHADMAKLLLKNLFACKSPMFTPDGKRTCKEISAAEIKAFFGE